MTSTLLFPQFELQAEVSPFIVTCGGEILIYLGIWSNNDFNLFHFPSLSYRLRFLPL